VLWNSLDGNYQLRLHIYSDPLEQSEESLQVDTADAHNHRWHFTTFILSGGYHQTLYSVDPVSARLIPSLMRQEKVGDCYTIHHAQFHSIVYEANTVTLLLRGPLEKEHFQINREGYVQNAPSLQKEQLAMTPERFSILLEKLSVLRVI
jgi:hypothetical protein